MTPRPIQRSRCRTGYAFPQNATASDDAGFTMMETVVSFVIFAVVATAASTAIANAISTSSDTRDRVTATNLAQAAIAQARANTTAVESTPNVASTETVGNRTYTVTRKATVPLVSGRRCPAGQTMPVTVIVTSAGSNSRTVRVDTVIAC